MQVPLLQLPQSRGQSVAVSVASHRASPQTTGMAQFASQPSPETRLPSSQASPGWR